MINKVDVCISSVLEKFKKMYGSAVANYLNSSFSNIDAEDEQESKMIIDTDVLEIKRSLKYAFVEEDEPKTLLFYPEQFCGESMTRSNLLEIFATSFVSIFSELPGSREDLQRFHISDFSLNGPSKIEMSRQFAKYQRIFPDFDFFNTDIFDPSLYLFFYNCFNFLDSVYVDFQKLILEQRGINVKLRDDRTLLYINEKIDNSCEFRVFGGSFRPSSSIKVFWEFEGRSSKDSFYQNISFDDTKSIYSSEINNYQELSSFLNHYNTFQSMPTSFVEFLFELKSAAFAEFAKPFIYEMLKYLERKSRKDIPQIKDSEFDNYFLLGPANRFIFHLESKFK